MGRTLGPFTDVSTARVDGAYEIYRGADDEGREVEILTLGSSSSKDPARRALLSDTVAWAHATRGPADASILSADLDSDQPYVVTLRQDGLRGVERMLERMLAMGPPAGPLSGNRHNSGQFPIVGPPTGHIPVVAGHTDPHGIPRVVSTPPSGSPVAPASPMASYVTNEQSSRPPWLIPVVIVIVLLVLAAGGLFILYGMSGQESDGGGPADDVQSEAEPSTDDGDDLKPHWDDSLPDIRVVGDGSYGPGEGNEIALTGWPFAFKVGDDLECQQPEHLVAQCSASEPITDATVRVQVQECARDCDNTEKNRLVNSFDMPGEEQRVNDFTQIGSEYTDEGAGYRVGMTRFYPDRNGRWMFVTVTATGGYGVEDTDLQRVVNSVATQTPTPDD